MVTPDNKFVKKAIAKPKCPYKAYFDRSSNGIDGFFTIIDTRTGFVVFEKLLARSGQMGYTKWVKGSKGNWVSGKSPVPMGKHRIKLTTPNQEGQFPTGGGIGEFWGVYNTPERSQYIKSDLIAGEPKGYIRDSIGVHPENIYKGSAGCIVLLWNTPSLKAEVIRLSKFLKSIIGVYEDDMPFEVL